ncbi:MAG TPA: peroxiredoxin-like family protein [Crenalkalicoccus sp.]|jgi:peroxiredoxin|nr:peroxiredoxin-like family protein [Crenalkalicoccus sp.]
MGRLQDQLDAFSRELARKVPVERRAVMARDIATRQAAGMEGRVLRPGDLIPDLTLPDCADRPTRLRDLLPAIIVFFRGGWCPYCALELRYWQRLLPQILAAGGKLVAISPQAPAHSRETVDQHGLCFPLLSDVGGAAARAFGLDYEVSDEMRALYREFGHELPEIGAGTGWQLPTPSTFVAGADARIVLAHADADYRHRLEPAEALAALRGETAAA